MDPEAAPQPVNRTEAAQRLAFFAITGSVFGQNIAESFHLGGNTGRILLGTGLALAGSIKSYRELHGN